jgi:endonuclease/exonuclease/phosphatase family metal-dependent hydrolase
VRIATWNVRWFPDGRPGGSDPQRTTDLDWLGCAIAGLSVDAIALQEVLLHERGRAALDRLLTALDRRTGGRWQAIDDGCPPEHQHLVFLVDTSRARIESHRTIAEFNPTGHACEQRLRPGLLVRLRFGGGLDLSVLALHLDSGTTPRDYARRRLSLARLAEVTRELAASDPDLLVVGDFNTMGCRGCDPRQSANAEIATLEGELAAAGLRVLAPTERCTEYSGSHASLLDHVAASAAMTELPRQARAEVAGVCALLACRHPPRDPRPAALERLSDHCPIVVELEDVDRDPDAPGPPSGG